jgi:hypothetical protein
MTSKGSEQSNYSSNSQLFIFPGTVMRKGEGARQHEIPTAAHPSFPISACAAAGLRTFAPEMK